MTNLGLVLPQKLDTAAASSDNYGKFIAEPFEKGYGHTVGHSLRRVLLSSLEGSAVTAVRIKGAPHEFSSLKGVQEDVITLILNVKQLRIKMGSAGPEVLTLRKKGGEVKAKHIDAPTGVEILNPELVLAHLDAGADFEMEIEVSRGRGFLSADRTKREGQPVNTIPVDALYSPVTKVHYEVENARVGQMTDYDKLILEVWTDGSLTPAEAVGQAARILKNAMGVFAPAEASESAAETPRPALSAEGGEGRLKDLMTQSVDIIDLTVRASNCLKAAKIRTIGDLVSKTETELLDFKNFGRKSLDEIRDRLKEMKLELGMTAPAGDAK